MTDVEGRCPICNLSDNTHFIWCENIRSVQPEVKAFPFEPGPRGQLVRDADMPPIREGKWAGLGTHFEVGDPTPTLDPGDGPEDAPDDGINDASLAEAMREGLGLTPTEDGPILSVDSAERKLTPMFRGCLAYFPRALAAVARLSYDSNEKHNPGEPLHWSKHKSSDHLDCLIRHAVENGTYDPDDAFLHDVKLAWRALANLEMVLETGKAIKRG